MTGALTTDEVTKAFARRVAPASALADDAGRVAEACHAMGVRFRRGGKLIVFGNGSAAADAQHVVVEFVHPVIVGKRALPAMSLVADVAALTGYVRRFGVDDSFAGPLRLVADPDDIAMGISADGNCRNVCRALDLARERGLLTVALLGGDGGEIATSGHVDHVLTARSWDPRIVKEIHVTTYHVLWELVHVFVEQDSTPGSAPVAGHGGVGGAS